MTGALKLNLKSTEQQLIQDFLVELSAVRFSKHCSAMKFNAKDVEKHEGSGILGEEMCLILLWGENCSLSFKTHYDVNVARALAASALNMTEESVTPQMAKAYMHEFNNLVAGYFRGALEENNVLFGMSLPISLPGKDENLFQRIRQDKTFAQRWTLTNDQKKNVICSCEIQLHGPGFFSDIKDKLWQELNADKDKDETGDIEFF